MTTLSKGCSRCLRLQIARSAIAGDLAEEREQRGWIWFWLHVVSVTFALWRNAATEAPLRMLALTLAGWRCRAGIRRSRRGFLSSVGAWLVGSRSSGGVERWTVPPGRACAASRHGGVRVLAVAVTLLTVVGRSVRAGGTALRRPAVRDRCDRIAGRRSVRASPCSDSSSRRPRRRLPQQTEWKDPSPHTTRFVTVDDGVQLEVLDWGGSGPALVLLAGLGATAHHYDDFAPALTRSLPRRRCDTARPSGIVSGPGRLRIRAPRRRRPARHRRRRVSTTRS